MYVGYHIIKNQSIFNDSNCDDSQKNLLCLNLKYILYGPIIIMFSRQHNMFQILSNDCFIHLIWSHHLWYWTPHLIAFRIALWDKNTHTCCCNVNITSKVAKPVPEYRRYVYNQCATTVVLFKSILIELHVNTNVMSRYCRTKNSLRFLMLCNIGGNK